MGGVAAVHDQGVCHRDLKPENLLLDSVGVLKISDFGLSNWCRDKNSAPKQLTTPCGTRHYAAPELLDTAVKHYDGTKVDVWSVGIILFVMVAGHFPVEEPTSKCKLFTALQDGTYPWPRHLTRVLVDLLSRMLCTNPTKRYTTAEIKGHPWHFAGVEEPILPRAPSLKDVCEPPMQVDCAKAPWGRDPVIVEDDPFLDALPWPESWQEMLLPCP